VQVTIYGKITIVVIQLFGDLGLGQLVGKYFFNMFCTNVCLKILEMKMAKKKQNLK